jgi:hypothetical protein
LFEKPNLLLQAVVIVPVLFNQKLIGADPLSVLLSVLGIPPKEFPLVMVQLGPAFHVLACTSCSHRPSFALSKL